MNFESLRKKVVSWGDEKGILSGSTPTKQFEKTLEEASEVLQASRNGTHEELCNEIGDVLVTIILGCELLGVEPELCLLSAYEKISKRTGKMVDGKFVKKSDLDEVKP